MNNKIIEFLSEREKCDIAIKIYTGTKETYNELLKEFPPEKTYHRYLDGCCSHSYEAHYPNNTEVLIFVTYGNDDYKKRAREIALAGAEDNALNTCMDKWRETQEAKKE